MRVKGSREEEELRQGGWDEKEKLLDTQLHNNCQHVKVRLRMTLYRIISRRKISLEMKSSVGKP